MFAVKFFVVFFCLTEKHAAFQIHCTLADTSIFGEKIEKETGVLQILKYK